MSSTRHAAISPHYIVLLITLFLCPLIFLPVVGSYVLPRRVFLEIMMVILCTAAMFRVSLTFRGSPLFVPWLILNAVCFASVFQAPAFYPAAKMFFFFFLLTSFSLIVSVSLSLKKYFNGLLTAVMIPGLFNAVYAFVQFFYGDLEFFHSVRF